MKSKEPAEEEEDDDEEDDVVLSGPVAFEWHTLAA